MTARDFIEKTLIEEYGNIVNEGKHDYISFLLISCGIEFLGRCRASKGTDWNDRQGNGYYFKEGLALFTKAYNEPCIKDTLYSGLRCGICHSLLPKEICLSATVEQDLNGNPLHLNIHTFYNDFKQACTTLLENENYKERLEESFMATSANSSGDTPTIKSVKQE